MIRVLVSADIIMSSVYLMTTTDKQTQVLHDLHLSYLFTIECGGGL